MNTNTIQRVPSPPDPEAQPVPGGTPPTVYYPFPVVPPAQRGGLNVANVVMLAILVLVAAMAAVFFLAMASMMGIGGRTVGEAGQRAGEAARSVGEAAGRVGQDVRDQFDPSHPPRGPLAYDAEVDEFLKLGVGQPLPVGRSRVFTVAAIRSREDADRPELSRYAVIHTELRQPN